MGKSSFILKGIVKIIFHGKTRNQNLSLYIRKRKTEKMHNIGKKSDSSIPYHILQYYIYKAYFIADYSPNRS